MGTVCIYQAGAGREKIREHGNIADLPVDEIIPVADTAIIEADRSRPPPKRRLRRPDVWQPWPRAACSGRHRSPPAHARPGGRPAASSPPGPRDESARRRRSSEITTRPSQRRRHMAARIVVTEFVSLDGVMGAGKR